MRAILISWLVEVHVKFNLLPETLYITKELIDRFSELRKISRAEYQLVGVSAMLIACKYEEIYVPEVQKFVDITDKSYTRDQIIDKEHEMLKVLEFTITFPTSYRFIERFAEIASCDGETTRFAQYLAELALIDVKMNQWAPSRIAAAAVYLAKKVFKREYPWSQLMTE